MKNKLVFRILGALASALIIVSVFVPYISVTGYSRSLWETYSTLNTLYLPIMIIVFGVIGVIFFALNIKTEFAYMSAGAIIFFIVMQTIDIYNQGNFNTLSIGYYFLVVGALLVGLMAFLCNLKTKKKVEVVEPINNTIEQPSMINQIDKLYNEQTEVKNDIPTIQQVDNVIQPIPVEPVITAPVQASINPVEPVNPVSMQQISSESVQPIQPAIPEINNQMVVENQSQQSVPVVEPQPVVQPTQQPVDNTINPVVSEFSNSVVNNPVVQEFSSSNSVNPVVNEFTTVIPKPVMDQSQNNVSDSLEPTPSIINPNPVIQDLTNKQNTTENNNQNNNESIGMDIFGQ